VEPADQGGTKELAALAAGLPFYLALGLVAPGLAAAFIYSSVNYYYKHRKAHLDPEWAKRHLPWHVDHHMGPDQDANWCVTRPWADWLFGTREPYVGTERAAADAARREQRLSRSPA
jgi:sterol desaturase/sphingolipid hydroxylase (fatty acid hydroxylase superfamily)